VRPGGVHSHPVSIVAVVGSATLHRAVAVVAVVVVLAGACADDPPEVPAGPDGRPDAELTLGRDVWGAKCDNCHGADGGGGTGPKLDDGRVVERYPDPEDQAQVIRNGRNGMPSFAGQLSDAEIDAVVRYTREVLN
jgi:mono/diheme cytochrome c family protein